MLYKGQMCNVTTGPMIGRQVIPKFEISPTLSPACSAKSIIIQARMACINQDNSCLLLPILITLSSLKYFISKLSLYEILNNILLDTAAALS